MYNLVHSENSPKVSLIYWKAKKSYNIRLIKARASKPSGASMRTEKKSML